MKIAKDEFIRQQLACIEQDPEGFVFAAFSAPSDGLSDVRRVRIRPIVMKGALMMQITSFTKTQSFTVNVALKELEGEFVKAFSTFSQVLIHYIKDEIHAHIEVDKVTFKVTSHKKVYLNQLSHNRVKKYELAENEPSELLIALGIQSKQGKIQPGKFDKFKQINRFLEIVGDIRSELSESPTIIDFGCGKAYLTFALFTKCKDAIFYGVDARADVIESCQRLAEKVGAKNLIFEQMRIDEFSFDGPVDLVVALHACDTATDAALIKAVELGSKVILLAPCCQHEVAAMIKKEAFPLLLEHGLLKERFAALVTDALRAEALKQYGYSVDLIEFIDPEHTPKNLLIRATRKKNSPPADWRAYEELKEQLKITNSRAGIAHNLRA